MAAKSLPMIVHVHASHYLGTSPAQLETGTDLILAEGPDVVTLTELYTEKRVRTLREKGYEHQAEAGTDSGALWPTRVWEVLHRETSKVTDRIYYTGEGKPTKPQHAVFVVLRHRATGLVLLVIANHFPPHIEGSSGPGGIWHRDTRLRVAAFMSAVQGIRKRRRQLRRRFKPDAEILTGDWNLNVLRTVVRAYFVAAFPNMRLNVPEKYRGPGTLGRRFIDWTLTQGLEVIGAPKVAELRGSDHRMVRTAYRALRLRDRDPKPPATPTPPPARDSERDRLVRIASTRLQNAGVAYDVAREVGIPYVVACALLEKESGGRNVWGSDAGGVNAGSSLPITQTTFLEFYRKVTNGGISNGVGPCQITYAGGKRDNGTRDGGFFRIMLERGLKPWLIADNMRFGFELIKGYHADRGTWLEAGAVYNGGPNPSPAAMAYGRDFSAKVAQWVDRFRP